MQEAVDGYMYALEKTISDFNDANRAAAETVNPCTCEHLLECERILLQCRVPVIKYNSKISAADVEHYHSTASRSSPTLVCGNDDGFDFLDDCDHPMGKAFHDIAIASSVLPLSPAYDLIAAARLLHACGVCPHQDTIAS